MAWISGLCDIGEGKNDKVYLPMLKKNEKATYIPPFRQISGDARSKAELLVEQQKSAYNCPHTILDTKGRSKEF